jgi:hypothetical protein
MVRRGIQLQPAELIGHHLGLIVDTESAKYFWNVTTGERPSSGYGTRISLPEYSLVTMFKTLQIPLKSSISLIDLFASFESFEKYLLSAAGKDIDILVCYDWPTLFDPKLNDHWGHVCVLDKVDVKMIP